MKRTISRPRLLGSGAAALTAAAFVRSPARAEFVYKLGAPNPADLPPTIAVIQMARAVKEETRGRLEIQVFPNSQLGSQTSMLSQVRLGSLQFFQNGNAQFSSIIPVTGIDSVGFAFTSEEQPLRALDGALGNYIRREFAAKGLFCFDRVYDLSFREVTSSTKPIRTVEDFAGFKLRTPSAPIFVDMFKAFGASPVPLDVNELYTALQTHIVDGQETPLSAIESYRLSEVQKYLSFTNHMWSGLWLVANMDAWNALPADLRAVVQRNVTKYSLAERTSMRLLTASLANKLPREGLKANKPDTATMRARLGAYYAHWKSEFGPTAWSLLEAESGKLG